MPLTKEHIIALRSLEGIGPKKVLKIGDYIKEHAITIITSEGLAGILEELNIKSNNMTVSAEAIETALTIARQTIEIHNRYGIGITTYYDSDFPEKLRYTVNEEGKSDPPIILFYKGDLSITRMAGLAIIGTRDICDFGENAGLYLSKEFARRGVCIVSGLALGCDTAAHRGALAVGGKTVAFLAHGLDSIYPPQNIELANEIIKKGGLLMSEYPIGTTVNRYNLVARDRLQAGLANGTLVIQTGVRGGTMHAANATLVSNKPLYVVKYRNADENNHINCLGNALLMQKGAKYISGASNIDEIVAEIISLG